MIGDLRRRLRRDESGLSMTELLVSSMLTLIILVMVGSFFMQTTKLTTVAGQNRTANGISANVANGVTSVLRVAVNLPKLNAATPDPAIVAGTRSSVTVYALSNTSPTTPSPVKVTFTLNGSGVVTENRCVGTQVSGYWTFGSCVSSTTRTLGTGIVAPTGTSDQLFTYRDANGTPIVIGTGSLTAAQRALVSSIIVIVRAQPAGAGTDIAQIKNTVVLRNLGLDTGQ